MAMDEARIELRQAIKDCRDRGLFAAAKWAAVQLAGLPATDQTASNNANAPGSNEPYDETFELARSFFDIKVCLC